MIDKNTLQQAVKKYRTRTYHLERKTWLRDEKDAIRFVEERGFVFFWPIKEHALPSLWNATVGDRPVPNTHDDPGHITWRWKDDLLDKRVWYYGKLLRKKSTILSFELAPYFYTLSPNYGDYENDYLVQYKNGLMSVESKNVYEALLKHGALHTLDLHKEAHMTSADKKYRFDKALTDLQTEMKIIPVGVAQAGRWGYAMIYDIAARVYPYIVEQARYLTEAQSQQVILRRYLHSVGAARVKKISTLFGWKREYVLQACQQLVSQGELELLNNIEPEPWAVIPAIFQLQ
ncbi:MAG: hypothetical protein GYA52_04210 [Chloroflexi bacterium]|nr:hypothetical protein [Chloroflexota bacterium]